MDFVTAIKTVLLQKYATFGGRARRSEYWWFYAFSSAITGTLASLGAKVQILGVLGGILGLVFLLPNLAVTVRRLHDRDRSAWFLLWFLLPIIGWIIILIPLCKRGTEGENRYGPPVI